MESRSVPLVLRQATSAIDAAEPIATGGGTPFTSVRRCPPVIDRDASLCAAHDMIAMPQAQNCQEANRMAFILGVIFFVVVVGMIDSRIPWSSSGADHK